MMNLKSRSKLKRITTRQLWNHLVEQIQASAVSYAIFSASLQNQLRIQISCVLVHRIWIQIHYLRVCYIHAVFNQVSSRAFKTTETKLAYQRSMAQSCMTKVIQPTRLSSVDVSELRQKANIAKTHKSETASSCLAGGPDATVYVAQPSPP